MAKVFHLYMDDTGTREPDRKIGKVAKHGHDWFALGGVLIAESDEITARKLHADFCASWKIAAPLHSSEIRAKNDNFRWLRSLSEADCTRFYEELYQLMANAPVLGIACTVDRPGYNARYREKYGRRRWHLCKTAFAIAVERSAKYARSKGAKLRVYIEKGDAETDRRARNYYDELRGNGMPFSSSTSGKYAPLTANELEETLYDFKAKAKSSPMVQFADLYVWPMAFGGYNKDLRPYQRLIGDKKIIDCHLAADDVTHLGCKYSCFELVQAEALKGKNPEGYSGSSAATVG